MAKHGRATAAEDPTRVVVHDFSGHPFQVQLARHLATRGLHSTHLYCPSFLTPKGNVNDDAGSSFRSIGVPLRNPFEKYSGPKRFVQELEYGWRVSRAVRRIKPDVVVSANTPLLAAFVFQLAMKLSRTPVVFWQQDVYSTAIAGHLNERAGFIGRVVGAAFVHLEKWLLRSSRRVVVISEDFLDTLRDWKVDTNRIDVIENWAPVDELPLRPRPNSWSKDHGISDSETVFLYAGTLGLKHEPSVLIDLARAFDDRDEVRVIVASEGLGADWLGGEAKPSDGIDLLPFQPYDDLPDMLACADVLIVLLEADAGTFSVPSKVLTYHCAGRALLGAMPAENLASRNIVATGSGVIVPPGDGEAFVAAAKQLLADRDERIAKGRRARAYAERTFDIDAITDRFVSIIDATRSGS